MNTYTPAPVNTEDVVIPASANALIERLAENAHENWAAQRISEGWTYGPVRNDELKQHPDLVPYAELSDGEREYDRITAMESIRLIVKLGYTLTPVDEPIPRDRLSE